MNAVIQEWLNKASGDFNTATILLHSNDTEVYDAICYHCQQCIEKLLKALLIQTGCRPPKTHVLSELSQLLHQTPINWKIDEDEMDVLTLYASDSRYPGYNTSRPEAEEALRICSKLKEHILEFFK